MRVKLDLSTGSPAADTWLGTMTVIVFAVALLVWDAAAQLIRERRRGK